MARDLRVAGTAVETCALDVTDRHSAQAFADAALDARRQIDVLVNNAGVMPLSPLVAGHHDEWNRMIDVNLKGVLWNVAAVLSHMDCAAPSRLPTSLRSARCRLCGRLLRDEVRGARVVGRSASGASGAADHLRQSRCGRKRTGRHDHPRTDPSVHARVSRDRAATGGYRARGAPRDRVAGERQHERTHDPADGPDQLKRHFLEEQPMNDRSPAWLISGASPGLAMRSPKPCSTVAGARWSPHAGPTACRISRAGTARALPLPLDIAAPASIASAVLVNSAGYGYLAAIEEGEDREIRAQFEVNVFGLNALTQRILPGMRQQRRGHIFNMSSLGGLVAFAATGYYHATKFAVEALSESLSHEVSPLGIRVTIGEPGAFRTDWSGRSMVESATRIDDYTETAGKRRAEGRAGAARCVARQLRRMGGDDEARRFSGLGTICCRRRDESGTQRAMPDPNRPRWAPD
ncbi:SDR family NAD(P)-dependent oxidoreductase [Burkholderia cenocepacia]|uniref:SDR family NAD(P)-dependent oxidoreductase n=2 Tax=Burkholderia cenocepacia TaxID=95486 RepID=UPI00222F2C47|nr:SDR family NAD(P)-dependent oxidoreductase [Burkholderia cenocepacia]